MKSKSSLNTYSKKENFNKYLDANLVSTSKDPNFNVTENNQVPFSPDLEDLVRLHKLVRKRKVTTVLEFGVGHSTLIIADALLKNKKQYSKKVKDLGLRRNNCFEIHCVDSSKKWIKEIKKRIPKELKDIIHLHFSEVLISSFQDRICTFYKKLPNITPDFVYIDAPSNYDVQGEVSGISFHHEDRTILTGDMLRLEPLLLPGTLILLDGRTNNARFLKNNFQRPFEYIENIKQDVNTLELKENPLGELNKTQIEFCLGKEWLKSI
jgi:hypothetical protein